MELPKFKLFDDVIIDGTATGLGDLTGMIWEEKPKLIGDKYYYTVRANTMFFVAEHHLIKISK